MQYVYILQSIEQSNQTYIGCTSDLRTRFDKHNQGGVPHTAKFKPWRLITYLAFSEKTKAYAFEAYLKSGSGRAFAAKRLR